MTTTLRYVAWNWKLNGGVTSTNSDGNEDLQVQQDAGGLFNR